MIVKSSRDLKADFWIAKVGRCTGKLLKKPYSLTNSYSVYSDDVDKDFARVMAAYEGGLYKPYLYGSEQPFIRIRDLLKVIDSVQNMNDKSLVMISEVTKSIELLKEKVLKLTELKKSIVQLSVQGVSLLKIKSCVGVFVAGRIKTQL